jgi:hypothetical protein
MHMPDFTYDEINAEAKRLGYTYPQDTDFNDDEIAEAVEAIDSYAMSVAVATLKSQPITADALTAFAKLASALGGEVATEYGGLEIRRPTTATERRATALSDLKTARATLNRAAAKRSLEQLARLNEATASVAGADFDTDALYNS